MVEVATMPVQVPMMPPVVDLDLDIQPQISNLMSTELWEKARRVMGVQGPVGWRPSQEEDARRQMKRQLREQSLHAINLSNLPPVGLATLSLELIDQPGMTFAKLEELLRLQVTDFNIDTTASLPRANMLRHLGVEMIRLTPQTPSGRFLRLKTSRHSKGSSHVVLDADTLFVIPNFSSFWRVPRAEHVYQTFYRNTLMLKHLHFAGTASKLFALLELIEYHLQPSIDILPPWRTAYAWKQALTQALPSPSS